MTKAMNNLAGLTWEKLGSRRFRARAKAGTYLIAPRGGSGVVLYLYPAGGGEREVLAPVTDVRAAKTTAEKRSPFGSFNGYGLKTKGSICGVVTAKDVLRFAPQIAREFGAKTLLRCCVAMVRRKKTTFLHCALAPGGVFDGARNVKRQRRLR